MGYDISQRLTQFMIRKEHHQAALIAIKTLANLLPRNETSREFHFAFVDTDEFVAATTLESALRAWRWEAEFSPEDGSIINLIFLREKLGSEDTLFAVLAPYVEAGCYIEIRGEDGDFWRWVFDGENVYKVRRRTRFHFEEPSDDNQCNP